MEITTMGYIACCLKRQTFRHSQSLSKPRPSTGFGGGGGGQVRLGTLGLRFEGKRCCDRGHPV